MFSLGRHRDFVMCPSCQFGDGFLSDGSDNFGFVRSADFMTNQVIRMTLAKLPDLDQVPLDYAIGDFWSSPFQESFFCANLVHCQVQRSSRCTMISFDFDGFNFIEFAIVLELSSTFVISKGLEIL